MLHGHAGSHDHNAHNATGDSHLGTTGTGDDGDKARDTSGGNSGGAPSSGGRSSGSSSHVSRDSRGHASAGLAADSRPTLFKSVAALFDKFDASHKCNALIKADSPSSASPESPSGSPTERVPRVEFQASANGSMKSINAVVPAATSADHHLEIQVAGATLKVKAQGRALLDDDELAYLDEQGSLRDDVVQEDLLAFLSYFPRGDIYGHLTRCVVPQLLWRIECIHETSSRPETPGSHSGFRPSIFDPLLPLRLYIARARTLVAAFITCRVVDWFILVVILLSSINLALAEPRIDLCKVLPTSDPNNCVRLSAYLDGADIVITAIFALEAVLNVIARGIAFTPYAYTHSGWRALDAVVVAVSIAALVGSSSSLQSLRALRALRALRVLRGLGRFPHLKLVIDAMIIALPKARFVLPHELALALRPLLLAFLSAAVLQLCRYNVRSWDLPLCREFLPLPAACVWRHPRPFASAGARTAVLPRSLLLVQ